MKEIKAVRNVLVIRHYVEYILFKQLPFLIFLFFFSSCSFWEKEVDISTENFEDISLPSTHASEQNTLLKVEEKTEAEKVIEYNDLAQKVAFLSEEREYCFLYEGSNKKFSQILEKVNNGWENLQNSNLKPMKEWSKNNIESELKNYDTVFYPFGGPDIANALILFPKARNYILIGLEATGSKKITKKIVSSLGEISLLSDCFKDFFSSGYFITHYMAEQLSSKKKIGVLPIILFQLARLNYKIVDIEEIEVKNTTTPIQTTPQSTFVGIKFIKIWFQDQKQNLKNIVYFKCPLDNSNKEKNLVFSWLKGMPFVTFIKSSSYAMHDRQFSQIRNFILLNSEAILQDSTGIPYYKLKTNWEKKIFGEYKKPVIPQFKAYYQEDLQEASKKAASQELPFKIGYGKKQQEAFLIFLKKGNKLLTHTIESISDDNKEQQLSSSTPPKS